MTKKCKRHLTGLFLRILFKKGLFMTIKKEIKRHGELYI